MTLLVLFVFYELILLELLYLEVHIELACTPLQRFKQPELRPRWAVCAGVLPGDDTVQRVKK